LNSKKEKLVDIDTLRNLKDVNKPTSKEENMTTSINENKRYLVTSK
jgi:hypothetical protein